uniref:Chlorophyllase n=1 Tax=Cyclophora tenuis TaxID=216820 RepID=A0A7S1DAB8_CYCTE|mmetsp:Transcript_4668/g.8104  ORF Transcript_4668/g.8104 Transcript_4668/m.8104 type:complete len:293 (+) Transcript_4668:46-924(+)
MISSFPGLIFLLLSMAVHNVSGAVVQRDGEAEGSSGRLRYHYDDSVANPCENVVMIGVGTTMGTSDYDEMSTQIVMGDSVLVIIVDQNPFWFVKTSAARFATFTNAIVDQLDQIVPVCSLAPKQIVIGGHSAGGQAAWNSIPMLTYTPTGFLGLDPFRLDPEDDLNIPALFWGFTQTSCQVTAGQAAKAGYQASQDDGRVFYQIDNSNGSDAGHCSFTDSGCFGPVCPARETSSTWVRESVAEGTKRFLKAISDGNWNKELFELEAVEDESFNLFVNQDIIVRRTRYLRGRE